jgi:hypothetical protein
VSLPGAQELFRTTGGSGPGGVPARQAAPAPVEAGDARLRAVPPPGGEHPPAAYAAEGGEPQQQHEDEDPSRSAPMPAARTGGATRRVRAPRRPTGRERHDEKITVYVSAEELMDLEHARLSLRGDFGLAVDRGRVVREAIAVVLADYEARGEESILVRRLRG